MFLNDYYNVLGFSLSRSLTLAVVVLTGSEKFPSFN